MMITLESDTFGKRLARLRLKRRLSQSRLAKRLNVAKSTIAMYETGQREPDFTMLIVLSEYFDVTIDYLITGKLKQ